MKRLIRFSTTLVLILATGACMKMGPNYKRPELGIHTPAKFQNAPSAPVAFRSDERWWEAFNDPDLNGVVQAALHHNLDLQAATMKVLEVRSQFKEVRADRFPQVNLQAQAERQQTPTQEGLPPGFSTDRTSNNFSLSLPASFELDLWGRLSRAEEAAKADLLGSVENRHTVAQSVVAEAATLYFRMEALERQVQITEASIEDYRRSLELVQNRYERGLTASLDVRQARRALSQAEAALPPLMQDLGTTQQSLSVLLGRYPETRPPREQPETYFKNLPPVPAGLPSELLLRRPDVRKAEDDLKALNARIGVAKANRFPRITLTGNFGYSSGQLAGMFTPAGQLWSLASGLTQSIFNAGKLKAEQRKAEARYQQGVANYAKTVLNAFSEVEGALLTRREQLDRRKKLIDFLKEARAAQEVAESRYQRGLVDYLTVLDAQQAHYQAELNLIDTEYIILSNRVTLHRAIGGGWATPPPISGSEANKTPESSGSLEKANG